MVVFKLLLLLKLKVVFINNHTQILQQSDMIYKIALLFTLGGYRAHQSLIFHVVQSI